MNKTKKKTKTNKTKRPARRPDKMADTIGRLYLNGVPLSEIAKTMQTSTTYCRGIIKQADQQLNNMTAPEFISLVKRKTYQMIDNHTAISTPTAVALHHATKRLLGAIHNDDKDQIRIETKEVNSLAKTTNDNNKALADSLSKMGVFAIPSPNTGQGIDSPTNSNLVSLSKVELIAELTVSGQRVQAYLKDLDVSKEILN